MRKNKLPVLLKDFWKTGLLISLMIISVTKSLVANASYTDLLNSLHVEDTIARPSRIMAVYLTGQSSWEQSRLDPFQLSLMEELDRVGIPVLKGGFPYNREFLTKTYRREAVLKASYRNAWQFVCSAYGTHFPKATARHLQPLFDLTDEKLVFITGSCGLQLLESSLPYLTIRPELRIYIIAIAPVSWRLPSHPQIAETYFIQGSSDWISRYGCAKVKSEIEAPVTHMGYLDNEEIRKFIIQKSQEMISAKRYKALSPFTNSS